MKIGWGGLNLKKMFRIIKHCQSGFVTLLPLSLQEQSVVILLLEGVLVS
jgi:hypothetical protein